MDVRRNLHEEVSGHRARARDDRRNSRGQFFELNIVRMFRVVPCQCDVVANGLAQLLMPIVATLSTGPPTTKEQASRLLWQGVRSQCPGIARRRTAAACSFPSFGRP